MSEEKKNIEETETPVAEAIEETVNEKPTKKAKATKQTKQTKQDVTVMYIGPSIANVVRASTVFKNGVLPEALKKCVEENPYMKKLLVPLAEVPAAMKELNSGKGALKAIYRKVKNEI